MKKLPKKRRGPPKGSHNPRKGEENRVQFSHRVLPTTKQRFEQAAIKGEKSVGEILDSVAGMAYSSLPLK